jgi:hypothetical protein
MNSDLTIYCRYENTTDSFQLFVFAHLERLLFPGDSVEFTAHLEDVVAIRDGYIRSIVADHIPCWQLHVRQDSANLMAILSNN